jgi:TetR/AcrR family transcriptional repressor of mexJK operon
MNSHSAKPAPESKVLRTERRLSPDARRQAIVEAAKQLFLTKGYAATSLEEIVAMSGGSLSTVYQLFGNKQGLWAAIVEEACDQVTAPLQDAMTHLGAPRAVLKAFAQRLDALERSGESAGVLRLILAEGGKTPELARTLFTGSETAHNTIAEYLDAQVAAGHLVIDDTRFATEQFVSMVCGDTMLRHACGLLPEAAAAEIERRLDAVIDMFLKAYGR